MVDSANFNTSTVVVSQSVTILAIPGALASVVATGGPAITISGSSINVTLRNLLVRELDNTSSYIGVDVTGGGTQVLVEDSEFTGLSIGYYATGNPSVTQIVHSTFRNNYNSVSLVGSSTSNTTSTGSIDHSTFTYGKSYAIVGALASVTVSHSFVTSNHNGGLLAESGVLLLEDNFISENSGPGVTLATDGGSSVLATAYTMGNNTININAGTNVSGGALTSLAQQ